MKFNGRVSKGAKRFEQTQRFEQTKFPNKLVISEDVTDKIFTSEEGQAWRNGDSIAQGERG